MRSREPLKANMLNSTRFIATPSARRGFSGRHNSSSSPRRGCAHAGCTGQRYSAATGQTLVEFALVLMIFMVVTLGLLDGLRVIFYYSQIQEAAREGARWGAVEVGRMSDSTTKPWGDFSAVGNAPTSPTTTYCPSCTYTVAGSRKLPDGVTNTIVGAVTVATTAVDLRQATVTVTTNIPRSASERGQTDFTNFTNRAVTVIVQYPFRPILGLVFHGVTINLKGESTMLHE